MKLSPRSVLILLAALSISLAVTVRLGPRLFPGLLAPGPAEPGASLSLEGATAWPSGAPMPDDSLRGRPVAFLAWSDTDPRALDALSVFDAWHRAYAPLGARLVAVHEPEFAVTSEPGVAARLWARSGFAVPCALDGGRHIEQRLGGHAGGPHLVIASAEGVVALDSVGSGALAAGEPVLRGLVVAEHPDAALPPLARVVLAPPADRVALGAGLVTQGPLAGAESGRPLVFTAQFRHQQEGGRGVPFPVGGWQVGADGVTATRGGPANFITIRYDAARAGAVLSPPAGGRARVWILRDGRWPLERELGPDARRDASGTAWVDVDEPKLYWLLAGSGTLAISPDAAGLGVHAFVFDGEAR